MTPEQRHNCMSHIRGANTTPERKVRAWLHAKGFRFRVNVRRLPGSPDIVLAKYRTCIFVNGCFWHGHDGCRMYTHPRTNPEFWEAKVRRNKQRDEEVTAKLEAMRWCVVTIWECELKKDAFEMTMQKITATLLQNRETWLQGVAKRRAERDAARAAKAARTALEASLLGGKDIPAKIRKLSNQEF